MIDHAFTARTEGVKSTPVASSFAGSSAAPLRPLTDMQGRSNLLGLWRLAKLLKITVLWEDIVERFVPQHRLPMPG